MEIISPLTDAFTRDTYYEVAQAVQLGQEMMKAGNMPEAIALYKMSLGLLAAPAADGCAPDHQHASAMVTALRDRIIQQ